MADWLKPLAPAVRGRAVVRTPAVLARYLDDLRMAEQAKALDRHFGRIPPEPGMFDNIDVVDATDPVAAVRAVNAAPRTWLESAELARAMEPTPAPPLTDMLLDNERRRALIAGRLDRLTPEQQARSLPAVGQQYDADKAAARAAEIQHGRDVNTAAALAAAGVVGGAAMYGRMSQLADEAAKAQAENTFDLGPDLSGNPDGAMPMVIDSADDPLMDSITDSVNAMKMPTVKVRPPYDPEGKALAERMSRQQVAPTVNAPWLDGHTQLTDAEWAAGKRNHDGPSRFLSDDLTMNLMPDSPDDAIASAPGPSTPVDRTMNMEELPGPQMRSIRALINAGIPASRATDIITKGASMSPDEYRMVTGGRR